MLLYPLSVSVLLDVVVVFLTGTRLARQRKVRASSSDCVPSSHIGCSKVCGAGGKGKKTVYFSGSEFRESGEGENKSTEHKLQLEAAAWPVNWHGARVVQ